MSKPVISETPVTENGDAYAERFYDVMLLLELLGEARKQQAKAA